MRAPDLRDNFVDRRISRFLREVHEHALEVANLKANTRILVVECRDGWAAEEAYRRVARGYVCGVDFSHPMITLAREYRQVPGRLEFVLWDRASLPLPDDNFDAALLTFAVHRLADPVRVFSEIARVLRPSGKLLVMEPTREAFFGLYVLVDWIDRLIDPTHVRYYKANELIRAIGSSGLVGARVLRRITKLGSGGKAMANATIIGARTPAVQEA